MIDSLRVFLFEKLNPTSHPSSAKVVVMARLCRLQMRTHHDHCQGVTVGEVGGSAASLAYARVIHVPRSLTKGQCGFRHPFFPSETRGGRFRTEGGSNGQFLQNARPPPYSLVLSPLHLPIIAPARAASHNPGSALPNLAPLIQSRPEVEALIGVFSTKKSPTYKH